MTEQRELDELPSVAWRARISPTMDRRDQLRLYEEATGRERAQQQVRLHREELARRKKAKP